MYFRVFSGSSMFKTSLPYILILAFTVNLTFCWGYTVQREESAMVMPAFFYLGNEGPEGENPESPSLPAEECELSTGENDNPEDGSSPGITVTYGHFTTHYVHRTQGRFATLGETGISCPLYVLYCSIKLPCTT